MPAAERGDPKIVGRNGLAFAFQFEIDRRVRMGGLVVDVQNRHGLDPLAEPAFVAFAASASIACRELAWAGVRQSSSGRIPFWERQSKGEQRLTVATAKKERSPDCKAKREAGHDLQGKNLVGSDLELVSCSRVEHDLLPSGVSCRTNPNGIAGESRFARDAIIETIWCRASEPQTDCALSAS